MEYFLELALLEFVKDSANSRSAYKLQGDDRSSLHERSIQPDMSHI